MGWGLPSLESLEIRPSVCKEFRAQMGVQGLDGLSLQGLLRMPDMTLTMATILVSIKEARICQFEVETCDNLVQSTGRLFDPLQRCRTPHKFKAPQDAVEHGCKRLVLTTDVPKSGFDFGDLSYDIGDGRFKFSLPSQSLYIFHNKAQSPNPTSYQGRYITIYICIERERVIDSSLFFKTKLHPQTLL